MLARFEVRQSRTLGRRVLKLGVVASASGATRNETQQIDSLKEGSFISVMVHGGYMYHWPLNREHKSEAYYNTAKTTKQWAKEAQDWAVGRVIAFYSICPRRTAVAAERPARPTLYVLMQRAYRAQDKDLLAGSATEPWCVKEGDAKDIDLLPVWQIIRVENMQPMFARGSCSNHVEGPRTYYWRVSEGVYL